jgi:RNA polymerase sigma-70 factor, ECF subfamily
MIDIENNIFERGNEFHRRILNGDITANSELAELALPILTRRLSRIFQNIYDDHLIDIAVTDALISYFNNPAQFQEKKNSLLSYLLMSSKGDLLNLLKPRKIDVNSSLLNENVEFQDGSSEYSIEGHVVIAEDDVESEILERMSTINSRLNELFPDCMDRELVTMILDGIRDTREYSKVIGIEKLDIKQQQEIVKRHKDRIKKFILRNMNPKEI